MKEFAVQLGVKLLGGYWLIASSSLIWAPFVITPFHWTIVAKSTAVIILTLPAITLMTYFLRRRSFLIGLLPGLLCLLAGGLIIWLTSAISLRSAVCVSATAGFIAVFNFICFEKVHFSHHLQAELVHRRYLEYLRSFFWGLAFILVGYLAWELQAFSVPQDFAERSQSVAVIGFAQLASVFATGVALVGYAFHDKLTQIERLR